MNRGRRYWLQVTDTAVLLPNRWPDGSRGFYLLAMTLGVLIVVALIVVADL